MFNKIWNCILSLFTNKKQTSVPKDPEPTPDSPSALELIELSAIPRLGDKGEEVKKLQVRLNELGANLQVDGDFGPLTANAVSVLQKKHDLPGSGIIGTVTLQLLKIVIREQPSEPPASPSDQDKWLDLALEITGAFEGKGYGQVTGNFDKMGLSVGILQWNYGQGSLQNKILKPYLAQHGSIDKLGIFPKPIEHSAHMSNSQGVAFAVREMNTSKNKVKAEWAKAWEKFMLLPEVIQLQKKAAGNVQKSALSLCSKWGMITPRAFCFFFDVVTQNGSMKSVSKPTPNDDLIKKYIAEANSQNKKIWAKKSLTDEQKILFQAAYLRARLSNPTYFQDVFSRKGTIAMGEGYVHGKVWKYNF